MTDNIENLVLEHLCSLRNDVASLRTEVHDSFRDVKMRLSTIENGLVSLKRDSTDQYSEAIRQQTSIDQILDRLERVEKRLELRQ